MFVKNKQNLYNKQTHIHIYTQTTQTCIFTHRYIIHIDTYIHTRTYRQTDTHETKTARSIGLIEPRSNRQQNKS